MIEVKRTRSNIEILANILRISIKGAKKSHIVYKANLNFMVVKRYLRLLNDSGLIIFPSDDNRLFKTTKKGIEYLNQYENLTDYIRPLAERLKSGS